MKKLVYTLFLFPLFLVAQGNLIVGDDATVTIGTGGTMTVDGTINVSDTSGSEGALIIQTSQANSGSFIAKAGGASQGKGITLNRQLDNSEWALIGVPVTGEIVDDVDGSLLSGSGSQMEKFLLLHLILHLKHLYISLLDRILHLLMGKVIQLVQVEHYHYLLPEQCQ